MTAAVGLAFADGLGIFCGNQLFRQQRGELRLQSRRVNRGQVFLDLLAHEHPVRADIDDAALGQQPHRQLFHLGINQRLASTNRHHGRSALLRGGQTILQAHHVLEAGGIFTNAAAAGAGQVAGVKRFELQHQRKPGRPQQFVFDDVPGDFRRQRQGETHRILMGLSRVSCRIQSHGRGRKPQLNRPGLAQARQEERCGTDPTRSVNAAATAPQQQEKRQNHRQPDGFPVQFHKCSIKGVTCYQ